jgi:hypothetical protein
MSSLVTGRLRARTAGRGAVRACQAMVRRASLADGSRVSGERWSSCCWPDGSWPGRRGPRCRGTGSACRMGGWSSTSMGVALRFGRIGGGVCGLPSAAPDPLRGGSQGRQRRSGSIKILRQNKNAPPWQRPGICFASNIKDEILRQSFLIDNDFVLIENQLRLKNSLALNGNASLRTVRT